MLVEGLKCNAALSGDNGEKQDESNTVIRFIWEQIMRSASGRPRFEKAKVQV